MKYLFCLLFLSNVTQAQSISSIEFVQVLNGNQEEAIFYFENNWKFLRQQAIDKSYIKSFRLMVAEEKNKEMVFDIILLTEYENQEQYEAREEHFQEIIKANSARGLQLLNEKKPDEFRESAFSTNAISR